jgi:putative transposase
MDLKRLIKSLRCSDARKLRKLVDHEHLAISICRKCALLEMPLSVYCYCQMPFREPTLRIMARIDALFLEDPCSVSRRMVEYLAREEIPINHDRVRNLMRPPGLRANYHEPRTRAPGEPSERYTWLVDLK